MLSISRSTVDCDQYNVLTTKVFVRYQTVNFVPDEDLCGRDVVLIAIYRAM